MAGLTLSIIICTKNRAGSLERSLQRMSLLDLTDVTSLELVVVNNGSTDATVDVVERFAKVAPFPVHHVFEPRSGLSIARNTGLAAAAGMLLMFTDDDCLVPADWVQVGAKLLGSDPFQVVGGRVELYNPAHLPVAIKTSRTPQHASPNAIFGFVLGANLAFGRIVVDRIGKFDVRLGAGTPLHAAEDTEFAYRALAHGVPVRYEPALMVEHDHGRIGQRELIRLNRGYSIGGGALLMHSLLAKRTDLVRPIYWDFRSALRVRRTHPAGWRWPVVKLAFVVGALRFLVGSSWKRAW